MNGRDEQFENRGAADANLFDRRDREKIRNHIVFIAGSVRRHRLLFVAVLLSIVGGTIGALLSFPKSYHVEAKAVAQPNSALTVRGDGPSADSLTRVAAETVLRRDNLLALIRQTDLIQYTAEHRAPVQRWRDAVVKALRLREDSEADRLDGLVELLEKKLVVWTGDSGSTVTIAIDWSDGPMACRLVDSAQRAFLEARYAREITALAESIGILQSHTTSLKADIDEAVAGIDKMHVVEAPVDPNEATSRPRAFSTLRPAASRVIVPHPELEQLKVQIDAKQRAMDELEEFRRHRLSELQAHLAEARTTYTENHPAIGDLNQSIAALSVESPQLASLRQETAALRLEYDRKSASFSDAPVAAATTASSLTLSGGAVATPPQLSGDVLRLAADLRDDRNPGMVYARGRLRDAMDKYAALRTQIESAQIDLETAQAAFKYRYSVVSPAHLPKSPTKPNVPLVVVAAFIAALLCGLLASILIDVLAGRLLERWQIETLLERPILGEITLRSLEGHECE